MFKKILILVLFSSILIFTGCATLFTGSTDDIYFNSNPQGADILIGGLKVGKTPATVTVKRPGFSDKEVVFEMDGYERRAFILKKSFNAVSILNLAGIGWLVDFATGALFKYEPKTYSIDLEPKTFKMDELNTDTFGRIEIPNEDNPVIVVDTETGLKFIFD